MASRFSTSTRVAIAAPALVLAAALAACHPPNEKPSETADEYTLPSYSEPAPAEGHGSEHGAEGHGEEESSESPVTVTVTEQPGAEGAGAQGAGAEQQMGADQQVPAQGAATDATGNGVAGGQAQVPAGQ